MSAWIVSKAHIDLLVHALTTTELVIEDPDEIGRELWRENHRSVNHYLNRRMRTPSYTYAAPTAYRHDDRAWLEAVLCYDYQSCERADWQQSKAHDWIEKLFVALAHRGVKQNPADRTYPWGYEESDVRPELVDA